MKICKVKTNTKIRYNGLDIFLKQGFEYPEDTQIVKDLPELFEITEDNSNKKDEILLIDETSDTEIKTVLETTIETKDETEDNLEVKEEKKVPKKRGRKKSTTSSNNNSKE